MSFILLGLQGGHPSSCPPSLCLLTSGYHGTLFISSHNLWLFCLSTWVSTVVPIRYKVWRADAPFRLLHCCVPSSTARCLAEGALNTCSLIGSVNKVISKTQQCVPTPGASWVFLHREWARPEVVKEGGRVWSGSIGAHSIFCLFRTGIILGDVP